MTENVFVNFVVYPLLVVKFFSSSFFKILTYLCLVGVMEGRGDGAVEGGRGLYPSFLPKNHHNFHPSMSPSLPLHPSIFPSIK